MLGRTLLGAEDINYVDPTLIRYNFNARFMAVKKSRNPESLSNSTKLAKSFCIFQGKARGSRTAIYLRSVFQSHLEMLGSSVQKHAGKVLFVAILVLSTFCVGLKSAQIHSKVHQLWLQEGGQLEAELAYTRKTIGEDYSATHQMLIQTSHDPNASVLHPQALLAHLDVLIRATAVKVHLYDTEWGLRDICNMPSTPSFEGTFLIEQILKHLIPCSIITPLDCFWEGSQLLGPETAVVIP